MSEETYNPVQYGFFTPEGGQWVFRGASVAAVQQLIDDILAASDETDGPGLLSLLQQLEAAGLLKRGNNPAQNKTDSPAGGAGTGGQFPDWVLTEAAKIVNRPVDPSEIKSAITKTGNNAGKPWYKIGDDWINQPRGR